MKAQMESACLVGGKPASAFLGGVQGGKVQKKGKKSEGAEDVHTNGAEMKVYLDKLQDIVPYMPKNKRMSKVEVISYVIDYIHELRETLGLPPCTAVDQDDCDMMNCDKSTSSLCSAKMCDNSNFIKKQDSECRTISGEE